MSAFSDRLKPPTPPTPEWRPPSWHYAEADRLLASVNNEDCTLPFVVSKINRAHVHALLAQYGEPETVAEAKRPSPDQEALQEIKQLANTAKYTPAMGAILDIIEERGL